MGIYKTDDLLVVLRRQSPGQYMRAKLSLNRDNSLLQRWTMKCSGTPIPKGMFWNLAFLSLKAGADFVELYCNDPGPSSSRSQWCMYKSSEWPEPWLQEQDLTPVVLSLSVASEADIQRELALRKWFETHCHGLPRIDMHGWIAEGVSGPDNEKRTKPAPNPTPRSACPASAASADTQRAPAGKPRGPS